MYAPLTSHQEQRNIRSQTRIGTRVAVIRWCVSFARRQDDCRVLRAVVHGLAERHGVSPWQIVRPFIFAIDVDSTRANLSMLCEAI